MTVASLDLPIQSDVPPGPRGLPLLGCAPQVKRDPLGFFSDLAAAHDGLASLRVGGETVYVLNSPDAFEHVFIGNWRNYKKSSFYDKLVPTFGNGIVVSEGDFWRKQRQLMNPAFHRQSLERIGETMRRKTRERVALLKDRGPDDVFDLADEITEHSIEIVLESLFGSDIAGRIDVLAEAVDTMLEIAEKRFWAVPDLHNTPLSRLYWRHRAARRVFDDMVYGIIERRRSLDISEPDLLGMLLDARDADTNEGMSDTQLRDEVTTLLVTGHESTANAMIWTLYSLTRHPEVLRRVRREIEDLCGDEIPDDGQLREQTYLRQVIEESMRLYPPAWTTSRTAIEDDEILGYPVRAGTNVMVSPHVIHQNPRYWKNPQVFDPERFAPENRDRRPKFAYIPFGGGPRSCIGSNFAMMEMQITITALLQNFDLEIAQSEAVAREAVISIRPRGGIRFRAHPRVAPVRSQPEVPEPLVAVG